MKHFTKYLMFMMAIFILGFANFASAQRSQGGLPPSFMYDDVPEAVEIRNFSSPNMAPIYEEDARNAEAGFPKPYRVGVSVPVNLDIEGAGEWTDLPDGGKIWRVTLVAPGAKALGVYFDDFWLPYGGELFLYNENKDQILGAFTEENNNAMCTFATQLVQGDKVTVEYFHPAGTSIMPNLSISEMSYNYRGVSFDYVERGGSLWCMININCSPEGDDWQDEKRGVVKQYMKIGWGYYLCTGSLLNNTDQDLKPYVLTAFHCGEGASTSDLNQWVFYYNYESSTCSGNWGPQNQTQTGAQKRAEGDYEPGSDFMLLELNSNVPTSYNAYFNGWDRRNVGADSGVNIHHPAGDIKKISTFKDPAVSSQWNNYGVLSHWKIWFAETPHGTSITEGGSSGSPLFNQDGLVVGDLTGGPQDDCENPLYSLYGKLSYSWDQMGSGSSQQLKPWLDPIDAGVETWEGTYNGTLPSPDFSADETHIQPGESVTFTDATTGNPLEWEWTFQGGDPSSYTGPEPPPITYADAGKYTVTLTASNTLGANAKDSVDMIVVGAPDPDFSADNNYIEVGQSVNFFDESSNDPIQWAWQFPGGVPDTSNDQDPEDILYAESGNYDVTLVVTNDIGTDTLVKDDYVTVGGPFADFEADQTSILEGESVTFTDLSVNEPTTWSWKFFGGSPAGFSGQEPPEIVYNNPGEYDVKLTVSNELGMHYIQKSGYIVVGGVGIGETALDAQVAIYPNPSGGEVTIGLFDSAEDARSISIMNALGVDVAEIPTTDDAVYTMDLSEQPNGLYFVRVKYKDRIVNKKLYLMR
ncbi:MAG: PKD domain-containing protein [Bacteroidales bacterium]